MVDSFTIRNFRSFKDIHVDDCRRINLVVGDNGSGKTALLEALFLAAGVTPELAVRTRGWRGFEGAQISGTQEDVHQALWGDLFHKFQSNHAALVSMKGAGEQDRTVTVWLNKQGSVQVIPPSRNRPSSKAKVIPQLAPIEFKWKIRGLQEFTVSPNFENGKLVFPPAPATHIKGAFFASNRSGPTAEVVNRFSALSKSFLEQEFIDRFQQIYSCVRSLSIEMSAGVPMLFAAVESLPEKIPLSMVSGGMQKLAGILLGIADQAGGVILIDEIENGFYYKKMPDIWRAVLDYTRFYNCQVFASTHSEECLKAAAGLAETSADDFAIIRTSLNRGETEVISFGGDKFARAMEEDMDVR